MRYFVAHVLNEEVANFCRQVSADLSKKFSICDSHERIPPHFTIQAPFQANKEQVSSVEEVIEEVVASSNPAPVMLSDFGNFNHKVAYLSGAAAADVWSIKDDLVDQLEALPFVPKRNFKEFTFHATLARADSPRQMRDIRIYLDETYTPNFEILFDNISLLEKNPKTDEWEIETLCEVR